MKKLYSLIALVFSLFLHFDALRAQTICTTHAFTNGNAIITFNVQNTNSFAINVTGINAIIFGGTAGTYTWTLLYNTTAVNSSGATWTQGTVGVGQNGWVLGGSASPVMPTQSAPIPVITGLTITIPANTTYGFALGCTGTIGYETIAASPFTFSNGGVNILTGTNISWGGTAFPSTPTNYPRGWDGCITWASAAAPCTGTPTAPVITTAAQTTPVCANGTMTMTATNTGAPTGIAYQWEQAPSSSGPWTSVVGGVGASTLSYTTAALTTTTWFRVKAICGTNNAPSTGYQVIVGMLPPGTITGSPSFCAGSAQTYSVPVVFGATSYTWTLPSGWTGTSTTNTINATAGTLAGNVSVTATGPCGTTTASTLAVTPNAGPPQPGAISGNNVVCNGATQSYSIAPVTGATSYIWTLPSGWTGTSTSTAISATPSSTAGNITVKSVNSCGSSAVTTLPVTITTLAPVLGAMTGSTAVCNGGIQTYSVPAVPGVLYYTWTTPSGWTGTSATNVLTSTPGATGGNVTVTAYNGCGTSPAQAQAVTVAPVVIPAVSAATSATTICAGTLATFTATGVNGGAAPVYQWKQNGIPVGINSNTFSVATLSNNDVITVTMTSNATCPSTPSATSNGITMTVNPNVVSGVNINATTSQDICANASVTFFSNITGGGTAPQYQWMRNTTPVGNNAPTYTTTSLSNGDTIICLLTTNAPCPSIPVAISNKMGMRVSANVTPSVTATSSTGSGFTPGSYVSFTAAVTNGGTQPALQWAVNGLDQLGETGSVYITNTLMNGDQISVRLQSNAPCAFPYIVGSNKILMHSNTSVKGVSSGDINFNMAPNPNKGQFVIMGEWNEIPQDKQMQIEIVNTVGQVVYTSAVPAPDQKQWSVNISLKDDISNGIYILRVVTGDRTAVKRFEVNR